MRSMHTLPDTNGRGTHYRGGGLRGRLEVKAGIQSGEDTSPAARHGLMGQMDDFSVFRRRARFCAVT